MKMEQDKNFTKAISDIHALDKERRNKLSELVGKITSNLNNIFYRPKVNTKVKAGC